MRRHRRWAPRLALAFATLLLLTSGGLVWLWHSPAGMQRVLQQVPGLELQGVGGRPTGGPFSAQRLVWQGSGVTVTVERLAWRDARWRWRPHDGAWLGLQLDGLRAGAVRVRTSDDGTVEAAPAPPASLQLPLELVAAGTRIGTLQVNDAAPLQQVQADVHLGAERGAAHRLGALQALWPPYAVAGDLTIGSGADLPVSARLGVANAPGAPTSWRASVRADGALQRMGLSAWLYGDAVAALADAPLQAEATVTPWAGFPLAALDVRANALDLRTLAPALPQTRLDGSATLEAVAPAGQPLALRLSLRNAAAGPWQAQRVPVRALQGTLRLQPAQAQQPLGATLDPLTVELGGEQAAGQLEGRAAWAGGALDARLVLDAVRPAQLDARAPALLLNGPIELTLRQGAAAGAGVTPLSGQVQAQLQGRLNGHATPISLQAQASFERDAAELLRITLPQLELRAGGARAQAQGELQQSAARWQLDSTGELARFDPGLWWPALDAPRDTALNARWNSRLRWAQAPGASWRDALRGHAELVLGASRLAGVPLSGRAELQAEADDALRVDTRWRADGNRFALDGSIARDDGKARGTFDIDAPALRALAPLRQLPIVPAAVQAWWPRSGTLQAQGSAGGQWPTLRTEGTLQARALRADAFGLERSDARWSFGGLAVAAPLSLRLDATGLAVGERRLDSAQVRLDGTLDSHRLTLAAASPLHPPAWADTAGGVPRAAGSRAELSARGAWQPLAQGSRWRGTLQRLAAAPRNAAARPWLSARDVEVTLDLDAQARPQRATLAPGAITAFGGGLRWQEAWWQAGNGSGDAQFALDAQLQPLRVAPLLARLQPRFDWRGDLALGGPIRVRRTPALAADVVIERGSGGGDLSLVVDGTRRELGLSDLRLGLEVRDGRWQLTQAAAGRAIGVLGGVQVARAASPQALWPQPSAPVEGSVELRVAELSNLSPWLPAGWRMGGNLRLSAALAGTRGKPAVSGELVGSELAVRNLLQGVRLRDGEMRVRLAPQQATIERFVFRDGEGEGTLRADGVVQFAAAPQAQLQIVAEQFRALDRFDRRITLSGRTQIVARDQRLSVTGRIGIDSGLIDIAQQDGPSLDDDVVVVNRPGAPADKIEEPPAVGGFDALSLDLVVDLGPALRLQGRGLRARLAGELRLTSPQDEILATGVIRTVDGTYSAYGQNLVIDRGVITFGGELANPTLDVVALRPDIDVRVGVIVSGRAADPRVRLYSEPEMAQIDQLTWMLLGRAPEGLGRDEAALLQRAALALVAGDRGGGDGLLQRFGLDSFSVGRSEAEAGEAADTVIGIGKQLSKRLYIGYERALTAAGGTWQLIYRAAGRLTLRLQAGNDESVDAIWTWRWE